MNQFKCYNFHFLLLIIFFCFYFNVALANESIKKLNTINNVEVNEIQKSKIALDDRSKFNSTSIYFKLNNKEFVIFETIRDFNFSKVSLSIAPIHLSIRHQSAIEKRKTQNMHLQFESEISRNNYVSLSGLVQTNDANWLYFTVSESFRSEAKIMRARLSGNAKIEDVTTINLDSSITGRSWPKIHYASGKYYLAYRKGKCCGLGYAMSDNGIKFSEIDTLGKSGSMPAINNFSDGKLLYNYQRSYPTNKLTSKGKAKYVLKSRFKISDNDGLNWGQENIVTDTSYEVHDAFPFQRKDGKIDIYYSHGLNRKEPYWSLWRRCVNSAGELGKEQLVANELIGDITKPNVFRRSDGTIALLFIEQGEDIKKGSIQYVSLLQKDSICQI